MPLCHTCETVKPNGEFYKGITRHCRVCWRAKVKANRENKADQYKAYDRSRSSDPKRVAMRKAYALTEQGKQAGGEAKRAWAKRNPEKRAAHVTLGNAVRDGKIIKPKHCGRCGAGGRIHAHHHDYSKPLAVEWLCSPCHRDEHKEVNDEA